jgi:hypothetical protein
MKTEKLLLCAFVTALHLLAWDSMLARGQEGTVIRGRLGGNNANAVDLYRLECRSNATTAGASVTDLNSDGTRLDVTVIKPNRAATIRHAPDGDQSAEATLRADGDLFVVISKNATGGAEYETLGVCRDAAGNDATSRYVLVQNQ